MKIVREMSLRDFDFWSGAKDTVADLTANQIDRVEDMLNDIYPDGMTDTQINDFFWFNRDTINDWLGIHEYPKWCVFKSKLGNDRVVEVTDETEESELEQIINKYDINADWYENDDEPSFYDVSGYNLDAANHEDFKDWLWELDGDLCRFELYLPKGWRYCIESGNCSKMGDSEKESFDYFMEDYGEELNDKINWACIWDTNVEFHDKPDFGEACDCYTLRIYYIGD